MTPVPHKNGDTVYARFEQVVRRAPSQTAIEYDGRSVTYQALHAMVCAIARAMPDTTPSDTPRVALFFEDRIHAIASMLGVLRAGGAFVPLDPSDPIERIRAIIQDCAPAVLLTDAHLRPALQALAPDGVNVCTVEDCISTEGQPPAASQDPDRLAYIMYTSGSTGRPKGVRQTQRNLLFFSTAYADTLGISSRDRLSLLYTLGFSAANMDIFGGLLRGATLCACDLRRYPAHLLGTWLEEQRVTVLHTVPTVYRALLSDMRPGRIQRRLQAVRVGALTSVYCAVLEWVCRGWTLRRIRAVDLGGEAVTGQDVHLFKQHFRASRAVLINHLAATEASVIAQYRVDPRREYGESLLPVGTSPAGVEVRIEPGADADDDSGLGALVVSSPYVSPGYHGAADDDPALFDDPARPGWRCYRSGDLGYRDTAGLLHYAGREGSRIKIRGQSVHVTEVEAALRSCPGVKEGVVIDIARSGQGDSDTLIAYVSGAAPSPEAARNLRQEMSHRVPSYMVPTAFVLVEALPLTTTGKVDRRELKSRGMPVMETESAPAQLNDLEEAVARIFKRVLKREQINRTDDFFLLGGDSLSAVGLQVYLSDLAGCEVPLQTILQDASVSGLAGALQTIHGTKTGMPDRARVLVPLRTEGENPALFLVHGRLGQVPVSPAFLDMLGGNQPIYAFQARGLDGREPPNPTVEAMARDYLAAMREVQPQGPYFLGGLCAGGYVAALMATLLRQAGEAVLPLMLIDPPRLASQDLSDLTRGSRYYKQRTRTVLDRVRRRRAQGAFKHAEDVHGREDAAVLVAMAYERALALYKPIPYNGDVILLTSDARMADGGWSNPKMSDPYFAGKVQIIPVASKHKDLLLVRSPRFEQGVQVCVAAALEGYTTYREQAPIPEGVVS